MFATASTDVTLKWAHRSIISKLNFFIDSKYDAQESYRNFNIISDFFLQKSNFLVSMYNTIQLEVL